MSMGDVFNLNTHRIYDNQNVGVLTILRQKRR